LVVILDFRVWEYTPPIIWMAATHLLVELLIFSWLLILYNCIFTCTCPLLIKLLVLRCTGIAIMINILWRMHSFDHLLLCLRMTLPLIRICRSGIRCFQKCLRMSLHKVGIELLLQKYCEQLELVLSRIVHILVSDLGNNL
jgi:hypothetical protein